MLNRNNMMVVGFVNHHQSITLMWCAFGVWTSFVFLGQRRGCQQRGGRHAAIIDDRQQLRVLFWPRRRAVVYQSWTIALHYIHLMPYIWSTIIDEPFCFSWQIKISSTQFRQSVSSSNNNSDCLRVICATLAYFTKVNPVAHCAAIIASSITTITIGIFFISSWQYPYYYFWFLQMLLLFHQYCYSK